jgi:hypothetical protein
MKAIIRKNGRAVPGWVKVGLVQRGFKSVEEAIAEDLFQRLETKTNLIQSKRVGHILESLARLGRNKGDWIAFNQLREPLKKYEWHFGLTLGSDGLNARLDFTKEMSKEDAWEHRAVRFLLSLVPHHINRLRRCAYDGCNGWFYAAKREDQEFCKRGACRQNYYDSDPKRREKKRINMQKNRKWHREQNQRAKTLLRKTLSR